MAPGPSRILLVEDNPDHSELTSLVMGSSGIAHELVCASDGQQALDLLRGTGPAAAPLRPDLVLLDIKLPRVDGFSVLRAVREDPHLACTPVVMLSTSANPSDFERAVTCGASDYLIKPIGLDELERKLVGALRYWLGVSDLRRGRPVTR
jgi:CheY-like chemotaxis protein